MAIIELGVYGAITKSEFRKRKKGGNILNNQY